VVIERDAGAEGRLALEIKAHTDATDNGGRGSRRLSETTHPRPEIARFPAYLWTPIVIEPV
jgi:hypothetical protein